jgi:hypothetical protein
MKKQYIKLFLFCIIVIAITSCKEEEEFTSGQLIIIELQKFIENENITEVQTRRLNPVGGFLPQGTRNFEFFKESIRVNNTYYNINRLVSYWVDPYFNDSNKRIYVLILQMDI